MGTVNQSLKPWRPSAQDPWNTLRAAHLLNRAGFGGTPEEIQRLVDLGYEGSLERIINYQPNVEDEFDTPEWVKNENFVMPPNEGSASVEARNPNAREDAKQRLRRLYDVMARVMTIYWRNPRPLESKLHLFWHGHFATEYGAVGPPLHLYWHHELLRQMANGNFGDLLRAMARDPAMLRYLDNDVNVKSHPNENWARELMELFAMEEGNYTEQDIQEAARAFTGWTQHRGHFVVVGKDHDYGVKTVLGKTGPFDGDDVIDIILEQPVTVRFMAKKLLEYFVLLDPSKELVEDLARIFRENDYEMKPVLQALFSSEAFNDRANIGSYLKTPVQLVMSTLRLLKVQVEYPHWQALWFYLEKMAQQPLHPPNVKGWGVGRNYWFNSATLTERQNIATYFLSGKVPTAISRFMSTPQPGEILPWFKPARVEEIYTAEEMTSAEKLVDYLIGYFIQRPIEAGKRERLVAYAKAQPGSFQEPENVRKLVHFILGMPEYQLC